MDIEYVKPINFEYRELLVDRLGKINNKQCYVDVLTYLHKHGVPYTLEDSGVLCTLNELEQSVVDELDTIITKYE